MSFTQDCNRIFNKVINDYHLTDNIDTPINNPYDRDSIENRLYLKCWIDTVQWHYEDIIRDPHIDPIEALENIEKPTVPENIIPNGDINDPEEPEIVTVAVEETKPEVPVTNPKDTKKDSKKGKKDAKK